MPDNIPNWLIVLVAGAVIVLFVRRACLAVVPENHQGIIERLGKFRRVIGPGTHLKFPFIEKYAHRVSGEQVRLHLDVAAKTKDGVPVTASVVIIYNLVIAGDMAQQICYGILRPKAHIESVASTTLIRMIGTIELEAIPTHQATIAESVRADLLADAKGYHAHMVQPDGILPERKIQAKIEDGQLADLERKAAMARALGTAAARDVESRTVTELLNKLTNQDVPVAAAAQIVVATLYCETAKQVGKDGNLVLIPVPCVDATAIGAAAALSAQ